MKETIYRKHREAGQAGFSNRKMNRSRTVLIVVAVCLLAAVPGDSGEQGSSRIEAGLLHLSEESEGAVEVVIDSSVGSPSLLRLQKSSGELKGESAKDRAASFFANHGDAFGIIEAGRELVFSHQQVDRLGATHLTYRQIYHGVPVFAAELKVHFDSTEHLVAVNGTFVPGIRLDPSPTIGPSESEKLALTLVAKEHSLGVSDLGAEFPELLVYRTGLVRGIEGANHLAWQIEVSDGKMVRELVYVDAHSGTILDHHTRIHEINRSIHHETYGNRIWEEGDSTPYSGLSTDKDIEVNQLIDSAGEIYDLFSNISGGDYLSYNGLDRAMQTVYEAEADPPCNESLNAWWNGRSTNFCEGLAVDDVIAHEWTHGYTDYNHNLIYQWQPGALNESYSDIFGEIVDLLNGTGYDQPGALRTDSQCSIYFNRPRPNVGISAPESIAGTYLAGGATFNPEGPWLVQALVELVDDDTDTATDGCESLVGFTSGRIALIDRGTCTFVIKAENAQAAGAVGIIVVNNEGDQALIMSGDTPDGYNTPAVFVGQSNGESFKAELGAGVDATLELTVGTNDDSVRWLVAEDGAGGAFRDMWSPVCFGDPGRVSDLSYYCSEDDNGGVHSNSGVPNHAFALIADGGSYNGYTIPGIGLTRAAHIYWRAMSVYQTPTTKFPEHADLIELSCSDLVGASLTDITTGATSSETINTGHCQQVAQVMLATEMREYPSQCKFEPVLEPNPPSLSDTTEIYSESFDSAGTLSSWILTNEGVFETYTPRDWAWTTFVPIGGDGGALFAIDSASIGDCDQNDQSGVMRAESPSVSIPSSASGVSLVFDHYVATEDLWDGGNLKISVNAGAYQLVPAGAFTFNPYNDFIIESSTGADDEEIPNSNPLSSEPAYTGMDEGELAGSWGQSQVDLGNLASPGDTIRVRFDFGVDGCNGVDGWYVDNFKIVTGSKPKPTVRRSSGRVRPGN